MDQKDHEHQDIEQVRIAEHHFKTGNFELAEKLVRSIIRSANSNSKAYELLAYIVGNKGDADLAVELLQKAVSQKYCSPEAHYYLGNAYLARKELAKASHHLSKALEIGGDFFEGLHDLGLALAASGLYSEALKNFKRAYILCPTSHELLFNIARAFDDLKKHDEALDYYDKALSISPNFAKAWSNRGVTLNDLKRYDEALASYDKALSINPNYTEAWTNRGVTLHDLKRHDEALASYGKALSINPNYSDAHWNEALTRLVLGQYNLGWQKYEYRWKRENHSKLLHTNFPLWLGSENLNGKKILIWSEQGYGDTIHFSRYLPLLNDLGAEVVFEVQTPLKGLVSSISKCLVVGKNEIFPEVDFQCPLLSLPLAFRTDSISIPSSAPYLRVNPEKIIEWKNKLNLSNQKLNIGIACSGSETNKNDINRSMKLEEFSPLKELANLFLIQKDVRKSDQDFLSKHPEIKFLGDQINDFEDTAGIVENMELIISVDTSLVHLAGALGKPVYILLPWTPEWRWLIDRNDSPWYPTAKLFRQATIGDWASVIKNVSRSLTSFK